MKHKVERKRQVNVAIPDDMFAQILTLRKTDRFCTFTYAEIIRQVFQIGYDAVLPELKREQM